MIEAADTRDPVGVPSPSAGRTRKTKVAVLVGALEVGGAELDIVRNFPRLDRSEFEVVVVSFGTKGVLGPELERLGIRVVARKAGQKAAPAGPERPAEQAGATAEGMDARFKRAGRAFIALPPVHWVVRKLYLLLVTLWVRRTLRTEKADIAHFFLPHSYAYGMFACWFSKPRARTVMSRLSLNFYKDTHARLAWLERNVLHRRVDIAIGNSELILDELADEGVDPGKLRLLHNGIDPAPFAPLEGSGGRAREALGVGREAFVIVAVGNLYAYKGHGDLIEACARVSGRLPDGWRLLIAGRDEQGNKAAYEELAARLGLADNVRLLGACDDVPRLLRAADVFVQPSHHEGLPNAIIEAMASSLPVIGTAVGGIPEAVVATSFGAVAAQETGWLVPPGDVEALSAAILEAAEDPVRRFRMGERARERVYAQFSLDKSVSTYEAIYRELMS